MQKDTLRLEHLVSLRGVAAWWVVFFHSLGLMMSAWPNIPLSFVKLISQGYLAVDFFFVLSGFIIFINYHGKFASEFRRNVLPFYWNRLTRIYPVHFLMLLAYLVLVSAFMFTSASRALPPAYGKQQFFENLFLVQAWQAESTSWNVPSWSVSAEWFVYMLFPFIAAGLTRFAGSMTAKIILVCTVFAVLAAVGSWQPEVGTIPVLMLPLVRATHEFLLGAIAGALFVHHRDQLIQAKFILLFLMAAIVTASVFANVSTHFFVPFLCFTSVCLFSVDESVITRMLTMKWLVYLGEISYSTYMLHYFVKDCFKATLVKDLHAVDAFALSGSFLVVLLASALMHHIFEVPSQNFLRKRFFVSAGKSQPA